MYATNAPRFPSVTSVAGRILHALLLADYCTPGDVGLRAEKAKFFLGIDALKNAGWPVSRYRSNDHLLTKDQLVNYALAHDVGRAWLADAAAAVGAVA